MKPAKFEFERPLTVGDAVAALARYDGDAKVMAGGQSLVPLLSMRLSQPDAIVDLSRIPELRGIELADDELVIGAMTTHREVETSSVVARSVPLLPLALAQVGHTTIRNQGTIGGSIAHADPAAELPAVALALDATLEIQGPDGPRSVPAQDFFLGFLTTSLEPEDVLTAIRFPLADRSMGWSVHEFARRHGDFALVAVFVGIGLAADGSIADARIALGGVDSAPARMRDAEGALVGSPPDAGTIAAAAADIAAAINPTADIHGSVQYRRDLCRTLTERALTEAASKAGSTTTSPTEG